MSTAAEPNPAAAFSGASRLLLLTLVLTGAWLALNFALPELSPSGVPTVIVRATIHCLILMGLWLGLGRAGFDARTRAYVWLAVAIPFTAWLGIITQLALDGAFRPRPGVPALPLAIFVPVLVGLALLLRSKRIAAVLDATPPAWLIGLQAYRVFGGIFLVGWARGNLSGTFALPAGIGDVAVGLLALPVATYLASGARGRRLAAYGWNILGLVDFALAIGIGFLSTPGPFQMIVPDRPNVLLGAYPTVMIPAFAVPSSILLHALSIWQLNRLGRRARQSTSAP